MNTNVHTLPVAEHPKAREAREKSAIRTFCYRVDRRNVIEVSSAIRHPGDKNDPHVGRMHMRMPNWCRSPRAFLEFTFTE